MKSQENYLNHSCVTNNDRIFKNNLIPFTYADTYFGKEVFIRIFFETTITNKWIFYYVITLLLHLTFKHTTA